jgi:hypothetical protein
MADIILINPRFDFSFWGLEHALAFIGKRAALPVAALPLLAALTPPEHTLALVDENVEPIDFERCAKADIVSYARKLVTA